jgi:RNA polymerase-binding transcription factor DksA
MRREDNRQSSPRWRAVLEARWRDRLQEVTELSLAYHRVAADALNGIEDKQARRLLRRTVDARRRLADTEEALGRLAAGGFGQCEQCGAVIAEVLLAAIPESRYCADCAAGTAAAGTGSVAAGPPTVVPMQRRAAAGRS